MLAKYRVFGYGLWGKSADRAGQAKQILINGRNTMSVIGMVLIVVLVIIAIVVLNKGPLDKESARREAYWSRYEDK